MKIFNYFNICLIAQLATTSAAGSIRRVSEEVSEQKAKAKYVYAHMHTIQIKFKM